MWDVVVGTGSRISKLAGTQMFIFPLPLSVDKWRKMAIYSTANAVIQLTLLFRIPAACGAENFSSRAVIFNMAFFLATEWAPKFILR